MCKCTETQMRRRSGRGGLALVTQLAISLSKATAGDVIIFIDGYYNDEPLYNMSPDSKTDKQIVNTIIYTDII